MVWYCGNWNICSLTTSEKPASWSDIFTSHFSSKEPLQNSGSTSVLFLPWGAAVISASNLFSHISVFRMTTSSSTSLSLIVWQTHLFESFCILFCFLLQVRPCWMFWSWALWNNPLLWRTCFLCLELSNTCLVGTLQRSLLSHNTSVGERFPRPFLFQPFADGLPLGGVKWIHVCIYHVWSKLFAEEL